MRWRAQAGHALTAIGERFGIERIIYRPSVMKLYDEFGARNAPGFAHRMLEVFGTVRYLDVGAGTGRYAEELRRRGARADACEYSSPGRSLAAERGVVVLPFDLASPALAPSASGYDVAICLEVAEHLAPKLGARLVSYLACFERVVFTAAPPGQGGTGHVNEQPKQYWESCFAAHGHRRDSALEHQFLAAEGSVPDDYLLTNLMIFVSGT